MSVSTHFAGYLSEAYLRVSAEGYASWHMAFTSEELDNYPLCGAKKRGGGTCRMFAGAGTDHKGIGRCKWHLGNTRNHRHSAAKQEAMKQATMGSPIEVTPGQAIQGVMNLTAGALAWLTAMVGAIPPGDLGDPESQALIRLQNEEKDRMARIASAAASMGISERQLRLSETQTQMMGEFLEAVMDRIKLTAEQRKGLGPAIRAALPEMTAAHGVEAEDAEAPEPPSAGQRMPAAPWP